MSKRLNKDREDAASVTSSFADTEDDEALLNPQKVKKTCNLDTFDQLKTANGLQAALVKRQLKGRKAKTVISDAQRKLEVQSRLCDKNYLRTVRQREAQAKSKLAVEEETLARDLITEMDFAHQQDQSKIADGQQSMQRFILLPRLGELLKKKGIQSQFLKFNGCVMLENWLGKNSDNSLPPIQVIEKVFDVLDSLPIEVEHLQNSNIARVLQLYASGSANLGQGLAYRATHLLQRWQVTVYQLNYNYDKEGLHELKHRQLKRKLEVVKNVDVNDFKVRGADGEEDSLQVTHKEDELIRKAPNGRFIMFKSNFDFLEKPVGYMETDDFQEQLDQDRQAAAKSTKVSTNAKKKGLSAKNQITASLLTQKKVDKPMEAKLGFV